MLLDIINNWQKLPTKLGPKNAFSHEVNGYKLQLKWTLIITLLI